MSKFIVLSLLFFINFGCVFSKECSSDQQLTAEAALRQKLFCNYDKKVRPVKYYSNKTIVTIGLNPMTINMNEVEEVIYISGHFHYMWSDSFLKWDPKEYENIKSIITSNEEIWIPDITINHASDSKFSGDNGDCVLLSDGRVSCFPLKTLYAYCSADLYLYPFDVQNCTMYLLPRGYGHGLILKVRNGLEVHTEVFSPNKDWDLINMTLEEEIAFWDSSDNSTYASYLECNIVIKRHSASHVALVVVPGVMLAAVALLTFLMHDMHSSRIAIAGITFIGNLLFCFHFGLHLPANGARAPLIVTFFRDSLVISAFAIATAIAVHHIQKISYPPYNWLSNYMNTLGSSPFGKVFFKDSYAGDDDSAEIIQDTKRKPTAWAQAAAFIDRMMFFICLFVYLILYFFFLP